MQDVLSTMNMTDSDRLSRTESQIWAKSMKIDERKYRFWSFFKLSSESLQISPTVPPNSWESSGILGRPWNGFRRESEISWLNCLISLDFLVRAPPKISKIGDQNEEFDLKTIQSHHKVSKGASASWISALDKLFSHTKLQTAWQKIDHIRGSES